MNSKVGKEIIEWIKSLVIAGIIAVIIHTFLFAIVIVDGPSMEPTLHSSERLILNKISYIISEPERGDIVVFHANEADDYIKRIIGLPGETVEVKNDQLFINGEIVLEPYLDKDKEDIHSSGGLLTVNFGPVEVQEEQLFVMGDNRRNSTDSRILGTIPMEKLIGKTNTIIFPFNKFGKIE